MDYLKIYNRIVARAKMEKRKKGEGVYYEAHHILPKCMGGEGNSTNRAKHENLVLLTSKEHILCHYLLCTIFPYNKKLQYSLWMMCNGKASKWQFRAKVSIRLYETARNLYIANVSENRKGTKHTEETKKKMSKASKGRKITQEHKEYLSKLNRGRKLPDSQKEAISKSLIGNKRTLGYRASEETKKKLSDMRKGHPVSKETIEKILRTKSTRVYDKSNYKKPSNIQPILQFDLHDNLIKEWESVSEVGRLTGLDKSNIVKCCKGKYKVVGGFIWKYKNNTWKTEAFALTLPERGSLSVVAKQ